MPSALPPRHTQAPAPPAAASASACLLRRRRGRLRVSLCYCRASTEPLVFASPSSPSLLRSSVAVPVPSSPRHANRGPGDGGGLLVVTVAASAVVLSACFVFLSAMRSMLECKKAAESLEKSFGSAREKLPETMASVKLVGREICDLAVDLSNLSQELRKGVQSSMSVVHAADAQLHQLTTSAPQGNQRVTSNRKRAAGEPLLASTVRELRELIAELHSGFGVAVSIAGLLTWASNFVSKRPKNRS
ncbi:Os06g0225400 [Oryza sativa Japonica Group]|uniref:Os06g0225400 protein n=7 Tax=Oryza TaxID=4527 RepID=A0A0P0WUR9_ORYSJ|nr:hypothetical protein OsI_22229 [Oryza sativa Indica Group]EEE65367.1 hypothetical protein OsJ_20660 [Oryza sativa Japonica Group]KAB8101802.1 hypothetical protein EE612_032811 [Oryza sativa]BAD37290.1 unknown protein [Oryza sativa Japonica Group]BAH93398.1 Os06g0225400 [Oryza sativa Japonica Group]|eukprot:NP_001174670.1 Os06g0225400 [Oryza sativa Japonica Group]